MKYKNFPSEHFGFSNVDYLKERQNEKLSKHIPIHLDKGSYREVGSEPEKLSRKLSRLSNSFWARHYREPISAIITSEK